MDAALEAQVLKLQPFDKITLENIVDLHHMDLS
jgi:hypothetical protein